MKCNIDAHGKRLRLLLGLAGLILGGVALAATLWSPLPGEAGYPIAAGLLIFGGIGVAQAWSGWCALRAMGFRTPV